MNPIALLSGSKLSAMFIAAFAIVIGVFVVSNSETILTTLGFQTKTSMAADLGKLNAEVKRLTDVNQQLAKDLEEAKRVNDIIAQEVVALEGNKGKVITVVTEIKDSKAKQIAAELNELKASTSEQTQNAQQRIKLKEKLATETINSLHEAYTKTVTPYITQTSVLETEEEVWAGQSDQTEELFELCTDTAEQACLA